MPRTGSRTDFLLPALARRRVVSAAQHLLAATKALGIARDMLDTSDVARREIDLFHQLADSLAVVCAGTAAAERPGTQTRAQLRALQAEVRRDGETLGGQLADARRARMAAARGVRGVAKV